MTNPTARSKRRLEAEGYTVASVEKWIPQVKRRVDMFGFADLCAIQSGFGIVAVQVTTVSNQAAHVTKILSLETSLTWLRAGGHILVHGWVKAGDRGKRKTWQCRERWIKLDDFMGV